MKIYLIVEYCPGSSANGDPMVGVSKAYRDEILAWAAADDLNEDIPTDEEGRTHYFEVNPVELH